MTKKNEVHMSGDFNFLGGMLANVRKTWDGKSVFVGAVLSAVVSAVVVACSVRLGVLQVFAHQKSFEEEDTSSISVPGSSNFTAGRDMLQQYVYNNVADSTGESTSLRGMVHLGWQLARFEILVDARPSDNLSSEEISSAKSHCFDDICTILAADRSAVEVESGLGFKILVSRILAFYSHTNLRKHAAILVGVAGSRVVLGLEKNLAQSPLLDIDASILKTTKDELFEAIWSGRPQSTNDLHSLMLPFLYQMPNQESAESGVLGSV